jgi:hypothetical protein
MDFNFKILLSVNPIIFFISLCVFYLNSSWALAFQVDFIVELLINSINI